MVLLVLYFGLQVKEPGNANDARLLPDQKVLRFQGKGIAYVEDLPTVRARKRPEPLTIEIVTTPEQNQRQGFSPLLLLHDGVDKRQIAIWQYVDSLIVMNGDDYNYARRWPRITGRHILQPHQTRFLTITASAVDGTKLYVDGELIAEKKDWCMHIPLEGQFLRLVLGNSVYGHHGWTGDIHGVAITGDAFSAERIRRRYEQWRVNRRFSAIERDVPLLFYAFDPQSPIRISDASGGGAVLEIPDHIVRFNRTILELSPIYSKLNRAKAFDMGLNVIGFVPLGAVLLAFLQSGNAFSHRRKWIAMACCVLLSLGIELAQTWIPTRYSSLLDLILNSFGAWIGIEMMHWLQRKGKIDLA